MFTIRYPASARRCAIFRMDPEVRARPCSRITQSLSAVGTAAMESGGGENSHRSIRQIMTVFPALSGQLCLDQVGCIKILYNHFAGACLQITKKRKLMPGVKKTEIRQ